ncbi:MAG: Ig-like domain-containing protein, partial [Magnetococcus sp. DMHC-8]
MSNQPSFDLRSLLSDTLSAPLVLPMENEPTGSLAHIPNTSLLLDGEFHRVGSDLLIIGPDGARFTVEGYFSADHLATLTTADGRFLLPETVNLLLVSDTSRLPGTLVAGPDMVVEAGNPIGTVGEITGKATAKNKAGVVRDLVKGDSIFQEDVIKTEAGGLIKLAFRDNTQLQLGENANIVLNKYSYNPDAKEGHFEATVTRGMFKYASGDLARQHTGRHTLLKTPTAQIGVRGSELQGEVTADGQTTVVHTSGILDVADAQGHGTVTLLQPGMATVITTGEPPKQPFQAPPTMMNAFASQLPPKLPDRKGDDAKDKDAPQDKKGPDAKADPKAEKAADAKGEKAADGKGEKAGDGKGEKKPEARDEKKADPKEDKPATEARDAHDSGAKADSREVKPADKPTDKPADKPADKQVDADKLAETHDAPKPPAEAARHEPAPPPVEAAPPAAPPVLPPSPLGPSLSDSYNTMHQAGEGRLGIVETPAAAPPAPPHPPPPPPPPPPLPPPPPVVTPPHVIEPPVTNHPAPPAALPQPGTKSSSSTSSETSSSLTGVLVDGPVGGVEFRTSSAPDKVLTGPDGSFHYQSNDTVFFSIGTIVLGQANGSALLTPLHLTAGNLAATTNILRLLQTLDAGHDLRDGITINHATLSAARAVTGLNPLADSVSDFETHYNNNTDFVSVVGRSLIPAVEAWEHFRMSGHGPPDVVPTGGVTISGSMVHGAVLVAHTGTLTDADGLGTLTYQWQVSADGLHNWASIAGNATTNSFTLTQTEVGQYLRVLVSYRDGYGTLEQVASGATATTIFPSPSLVITSNVAAVKAGETATITFTFNTDPVGSFFWDGSTGDVVVTGGTLGAISGAGLTRIATFTPTPGTAAGSASITVASGLYTDAAGNTGGAGTTPSISIDTLAPTLAITSNVAAVKAGETATITFTFSEDPGGSFLWNGTTGDVVVTGGTLGSISGTGLTRTAIFTPTVGTASGSASITVASGVYTDAAGNAGGSGATPSISIDTLAPTLSSSTPADNATGVAATSNIVLTFSENVAAGTGNMIVSNGVDTRTIAVSDATQVTISGTSVTINPTADLLYSTTYYVQLAGGVIRDAAGNHYAGITDTTTLNFAIAPASVMNLSTLNGAAGFRLDGLVAGDNVGFSVQSAGDINGDGFDDLAVGAMLADPNGLANAGSGYVIFGKSTGFASTLNLATLDGSSGFRLDGAAANDWAGRSISSAGDVNGDGFGDLIMGAQYADPNGITNAGSSYVLFGKATGFASALNLSTLNGTSGFRVDGASTNDFFGLSVNSAGDINGDGLDDLIFGALFADPNGQTDAGSGYVVFGKVSGFASALDLSSLNGNTGFRLDGVTAGDSVGRHVNAAGDVNGDGWGDLIVGAPGNASSSYVVFGKASGFASTIQLSALDGNAGFRLDGMTAGDLSGFSVNSAGDINGDGLDDLVIGGWGADPNGQTNAGSSYVVFGKTTAFSSVINLSTLNGSTGFRLDGVATNDYSGNAVSSAGDVNGDGFDDLIVGGHGADPNGVTNAGSGYLVFGKASGFASVIHLSALDGNIGLRLDGVAANDIASFAVSTAGDINADGYGDLIIGAHAADPNGTDSGSAYVLFGNNMAGAVTFLGTSGADTLSAGTSAAERFVSGGGHDTMTGGGGADVFYGGAGNDVITVADLIFQLVDGGSGTDTLALSGTGMTLTLANVRGKVEGIEKIDLTGSGNNILMLAPLDLLSLSDLSNTLTVAGNAGDVVNAGTGWTDGGVVGGYHVYTAGQAVLNVATAVATVAMPTPASVINLSTLNGSTGFRLDGLTAGDRTGWVSSAGDVNGDGFHDLIVSADHAAPNGANSGSAYVIFGKSSGFAATLNPTTLDGSTGFRLDGVATGDFAGISVGSGDVNGDGFADLVIGALNADPNTLADAGSSYVVFGRATGFAAAINLSSLDGTTGFRLDGVAAGDLAGGTLCSAGDVNGDGLDDLFIGAQYADPNGQSAAGSSYVVFGKTSGFGSSINLSTLDGATGFRLDSAAAGDRSSYAIGSAGDVNGDGFADMIVSSPPNTGHSYVIFGKASGFAASIALSSLDGNTGFRMTNGIAWTARSASSAGDVNGDGFGDVMVGLHGANGGAGASYVVFGHSGSFNSSIDLGTLDGNTGFRLNGSVANSSMAVSNGLASAGDINGDGFDDLLIAAGHTQLNGANSGSTYVVFGHASSFSSAINLSALNGSTGFRLDDAAGSHSAYGEMAVRSAGDINGDGFADLMVGAASTNGGAGASYIIFGSNSTSAVTFLGTSGANTLNAGTSAAERFVSGGGNDTMAGGGGADVFHGGEGNDIITVSDLAFQRVDGGTGTDTLALAGAGIILTLSALRGKIDAIETINLTGSGNNTLTLTALDALNLSDSSNVLKVDGNAGDVVNAGAGWTDAGVSGGYHVYTQGQAILQVATAVTLSPPSIIPLSGLNGSTGFRLDGVTDNDYSGASVSSAGDVNGDGFDDLIVGAKGANPNVSVSGASYVVFGKSSGFSSAINLSSLDGSTGFRLDGVTAADQSGISVSSSGDVNGDGFDDLIVGAHKADPNGSASGASYVLFGKASGFGPAINLSSLDGNTGFRLNGVASQDYSGQSVSLAGDVNGDGFDDLIVGADRADPNGTSSGASYVVFGKSSGFSSAINLSSLDGNTGFRLNGVATLDRSGFPVSSAGDVNGDGFDDLIVGAYGADLNGSYSGASYVVFGKGSGFGSAINLSSLDGNTGFRLNGVAADDRSGWSVSLAGDVNGDGFDDLIVGAFKADPNGIDSGTSYVVFGKGSGFGSAINLSSLDGNTGFCLNGVVADERSGTSVSSAGDVNGDGFDDLIVGAPWATPNGTYSGGSYVVFGKASGFGSAINLSSLDGNTGFRLNGVATEDYAGQSVSSAGDINGDGFDDLIVGAHKADPNGSYSGSSYIIFGSNSTNAVTFLGTSGADTLSAGTLAAERFVSGGGNDTMTGGGGADVFHGGEGNDTITVSDLTFQLVDGGTGSDTLALSGAGMTLTLASLRGKIEAIERIDLTGSGNNTLVLTALDVLNLSDSSNTLKVDGNAGDVTSMEGIWTDGGVIGSYHVYTRGQATLHLSDAVTGVFVVTDALLLRGIGLFNPTVAVQSGGSLTIDAAAISGSSATQTFNGHLSNAGTLTFNTDSASYNATLTMAAGTTLTNSGLITLAG